jgi:CHASE1-domain containing sensor protein
MTSYDNFLSLAAIMLESNVGSLPCKGIGWIPRVEKNDRRKYQSIGASAYDNYTSIKFQYKSSTLNGGFVQTQVERSSPEVSLPILYVTPAEQNKDIIGVDIMGIPQLNEAYHAAVQKERVVMTNRITFEESLTPTVFLFLPAINNSRAGGEIGCVFMALNIANFFNDALKLYVGLPGDQTLVCDEYSGSSSLSDQFLYSKVNVNGSIFVSGSDPGFLLNEFTFLKNCTQGCKNFEYCHTTTLSVGSREWTLTFLRTTKPNVLASFVLFGLIVFITVILILLVKSTVKHTLRTQQVTEAEKKAKELARQGQKLAEEANNCRNIFMSKVSSQLRTPMVLCSSIYLYTSRQRDLIHHK